MNYKEWKETAMSYSRYYPGVYLKGLIKTRTLVSGNPSGISTRHPLGQTFKALPIHKPVS